MDKLKVIVELAEKLYERGVNDASFVLVGVDVYKDIRLEAAKMYQNPYANHGFQTFQVHTSIGSLPVKFDKDKPADYIGINGITLLDIIAEEALLGI